MMDHFEACGGRHGPKNSKKTHTDKEGVLLNWPGGVAVSYVRCELS